MSAWHSERLSQDPPLHFSPCSVGRHLVHPHMLAPPVRKASTCKHTHSPTHMHTHAYIHVHVHTCAPALKLFSASSWGLELSLKKLAHKQAPLQFCPWLGAHRPEPSDQPSARSPELTRAAGIWLPWVTQRGRWP